MSPHPPIRLPPTSCNFPMSDKFPSSATPNAVVDPNTYRVRLRFRVQKKLDIQSQEHRFQVIGHDVALRPPLPDVDIRDSEWLVFNARGFITEGDALNFGQKLRAALEVSS